LSRAAEAGGQASALRLDAPWQDLTDAERQLVIEGRRGFRRRAAAFFRRLERKKYKVHVPRVLSRYRGYLTCPECNGTRLRREARDVRVGDRTIDDVLRADREGRRGRF
jgi:excinuclease ABC subunit A